MKEGKTTTYAPTTRAIVAVVQHKKMSADYEAEQEQLELEISIIVVYAPDKSTGKCQQKLRIIFNFVDEVEISSIAEPIIYKRPPKKQKSGVTLKATPLH